jgi:fluoroacetyl-CoA thioesterase
MSSLGEGTAMKDGFEPGVSASIHTVVTAEMLPVLEGQQVFPVLATAGLVNMMELACRKLIKPYLEGDEEALGVEFSVDHLATCGAGKTVKTTAELAECRHGRVRFHVASFDGERLLGTGVHIQWIMTKAQADAAFQAGC